VRIWVDGDGCPNDTKQVVFRASDRLGVETRLVANAVMATPRWPLVTSVLVSHDFNAADDHIAEVVSAGDVVVTADIPLAARVVEKGAVAINPRGEVYDQTNVGECLAMRNLMQELRSGGYIQGGPAAFGTGDKRRFAVAFDRLLTKMLKDRPEQDA